MQTLFLRERLSSGLLLQGSETCTPLTIGLSGPGLVRLLEASPLGSASLLLRHAQSDVSITEEASALLLDLVRRGGAIRHCGLSGFQSETPGAHEARQADDCVHPGRLTFRRAPVVCNIP